MKAIPIIGILIFICSFSFSQKEEDISTHISTAFSTGKVEQIVSYFYKTIDITLPNSEGTYSQSQGELILADFFEKNPPSSFKVNHQGSSNQGSIYIIGTYTSNKLAYRSYVLLKKVGEKYFIQQIQFDKETG